MMCRLVLMTLLLSPCACIRLPTPLLASQPLTPVLDSGMASLADRAILALALVDMTGGLSDRCGPLIPPARWSAPFHARPIARIRTARRCCS